MILDEIVAATRKRIEREKDQHSLKYYMSMIQEQNPLTKCDEFLLEQRLRKPGIHLICEVKKASPSKGVISEKFDYVAIAREYEQARASAISVLTEPDFFQGDIRYLKEINRAVQLPLLRKDFILEPYQIYQAKAMGASGILLICAILTKQQLTEYIQICNELQLSALVEIHDSREGQIAVEAGARMVGVNNRNLKDFTVDIENSIRLRNEIPKEILFVAESGIRTADDVRRLYDKQVNAILIGETMMRSRDKLSQVQELLSRIPIL